MDEPVRNRLRPARHSGLTRPIPGHRTAQAPAAARQHLPSERPGQAAEQASGGKATPGKPSRSLIRRLDIKISARIYAVDRGLGRHAERFIGLSSLPVSLTSRVLRAFSSQVTVRPRGGSTNVGSSLGGKGTGRLPVPVGKTTSWPCLSKASSGPASSSPQKPRSEGMHRILRDINWSPHVRNHTLAKNTASEQVTPRSGQTHFVPYRTCTLSVSTRKSCSRPRHLPRSAHLSLPHVTQEAE